MALTELAEGVRILRVTYNYDEDTDTFNVVYEAEKALGFERVPLRAQGVGLSAEDAVTEATHNSIIGNINTLADAI